jgi:hypothetical protein
LFQFSTNVADYFKIRVNNAVKKGIIGHFSISFTSSAKVVSSSRNLNIKVEFPFSNKDENILEPNALFLSNTSRKSKS